MGGRPKMKNYYWIYSSVVLNDCFDIEDLADVGKGVRKVYVGQCGTIVHSPSVSDMCASCIQ